MRGLYSTFARFTGYLIVLVQGAALERLLNLASANGVYIWDIRRQRPDLMIMRVGIRGFKALRPLLRKAHCRARIEEKRGWPFIWRRAARRSGLLAGSLVFAAVIACASGFIWRIEIVGTKRIPAAVLRSDLKGLGLYEGVWRGKIDKDRIEQQIEIMTPDAVWIGLEVRGVVAVVRVVERTKPPDLQPGDLVAARPGLITKIVVYRGTPVVAEGDTVKAGQLLVSGSEVRINADGSLESRQVPASGSLEARVWDEERVWEPLNRWRMVPTGRRAKAIRLRIGSWTLALGAKKAPYQWYTQSRGAHGLGGGRNTLPLVELIVDSYHEVCPVLDRRGAAAVETLAVREARSGLRKRLPKQPADSAQVYVHREAGWVEAVAELESVQNIAVPARKEH